MEQTVEEIMAQLYLDEVDLTKRETYLAHADAYIALLQKIRDALAVEGEFADAFDDHVFGLPQPRTLLTDATTVARRKHTQTQHFHRLTAGRYGQQSVRSCLRFGILHQRIGLETTWYIGADCKIQHMCS